MTSIQPGSFDLINSGLMANYKPLESMVSIQQIQAVGQFGRFFSEVKCPINWLQMESRASLWQAWSSFMKLFGRGISYRSSTLPQKVCQSGSLLVRWVPFDRSGRLSQGECPNVRSFRKHAGLAVADWAARERSFEVCFSKTRLLER